MDRGFFITLNSVRRQLAAMPSPSELYLVRLIHNPTRKPFPAQPLWTGFQLSRDAMIRFLRLRNSQGYDIYLRPYAEKHNAGYLLLDLDLAAPSIIHTLRANGHEPCVVVQTSPGHLQAWLRVSETPLEPARATALGQQLARTYGGDPASADWGHLGRLAGFTNQKPARRQPRGHAPWVRLLHAQVTLARQAAALIAAAETLPSTPPARPAVAASKPTGSCALTPAGAAHIYRRVLNRLRIPERFPQTDWSIADLWIAKELLRCRTPAEQVQAILRLASPGFPRRHSQPEDYLARTLRRAALELGAARFPARSRAPCVQACPVP